MSLLRSFFETDRKAIFVSIFAGIVSGACTTMLIAYIGDQFASTEKFDAASALWFFSLLIIAQVASLYASKTLIEVSTNFSYKIRLKFCRRILNTEFARLEAVGGHRLTAAFAEDMTNISIAFGRVPVLVIDSTRLLFCVGYLFWLAPGVITVLFLFLIPIGYVQMLLLKHSKQEMRNILPIRDRRYSLYEQMIVGIKELLVNRFWKHNLYWTHLASNAEEFKQSQRRMLMASQYASQWAQSTYFVVIFGLLMASSLSYVGVEVVASFALVGLFVRASINNLIAVIPVWFQAKTSSEKIESLSLSQNHSILSANSQVATEPHGTKPITLKLSQLCFSFPEDKSLGKTTLGPIDLSLHSGEVVFITGGNGSGKTTLIKLLISLYQPDSGQIYLDGQPVTATNREWYQGHFYSLFSDFNLSNEFMKAVSSLKNQPNSLAFEKLSEIDLKSSDWLDSKSTASYSSGQRARLALYPMMTLDRPILIFDEWAAHQSPKYKHLFYNELLPELKSAGKLVIVITHDDRYFGLADRVVKLDSGAILE